MLRSSGLRLFIVGLLTIFMTIPLMMAGAVISDRAYYSEDTIREVGREWGGVQTIRGPQLIIPVEKIVRQNRTREITDPVTGETRSQTYQVDATVAGEPLRIYPTTFDATLELSSEIRSRGIFDVPVYNADTGITFDFDLEGAEAMMGEKETLLWDEARVETRIGSNRGLRGEASLTDGGEPLALEPLATGNSDGGITAAVGDPRELGTLRLDLSLNGAERIFIAPVGRTSRIEMISDWPHPSFTGAYLPDESTVTETGFSAKWTIPHLARSLPQMSRENYDSAANTNAFGVRFFQPNDFYQKAFRIAQYGILFIALTFLTVFLTENRSEKPAHPIQYIMIGLVQSLFVVLMVAYAEQIGFTPAYALSATAVIGLITFYGATALKLGRRTWVLFATLISLYALIYFILQSADYALILGATLAFAALAGTMMATRNEDWYGKPKEPGRGFLSRFRAPPPPAPVTQEAT